MVSRTTKCRYACANDCDDCVPQTHQSQAPPGHLASTAIGHRSDLEIKIGMQMRAPTGRQPRPTRRRPPWIFPPFERFRCLWQLHQACVHRAPLLLPFGCLQSGGPTRARVPHRGRLSVRCTTSPPPRARAHSPDSHKSRPHGTPSGHRY